MNRAGICKPAPQSTREHRHEYLSMEDCDLSSLVPASACRGGARQEMQGRHPEGPIRLYRQRLHPPFPPAFPGTPWVPKAILEVLHFNGDGTLTTPVVAIATPVR
jgi:hypothetical protein